MDPIVTQNPWNFPLSHDLDAFKNRIAGLSLENVQRSIQEIERNLRYHIEKRKMDV